MEILITVVGIAILLSLGGLILLMVRLSKKKEDTGGMLLIQERISELSRTVDNKLGSGQKEVQESLKYQLDSSQRLMRDIAEQIAKQSLEVQKGLSDSAEQSRKVFGITEQLKQLERVLTHQKQRGSLGERSLELILENVLPPGIYRFQHHFKNGDAVDAVIETKEGMIPIDAKFSLDNYIRLNEERDDARKEELSQIFIADLKKRVDETAKYIRPSEGTLPFALMYIPAEGIYYDLLVNEMGNIKTNSRSILEYATAQKKVIVVSPTTLLAYLETVLLGYKAFRVEETAKEIVKNVENLSRHLSAFGEYHDKMGKTINTVVKQWNDSSKEFGKIDKDIMKITGETVGIEVLSLDKANTEENG